MTACSKKKAVLQRFLCHTQETSGEEGDEIKYRNQTCYFKLQRSSNRAQTEIQEVLVYSMPMKWECGNDSGWKSKNSQLAGCSPNRRIN